jgi:hypothetical protein
MSLNQLHAKRAALSDDERDAIALVVARAVTLALTTPSAPTTYRVIVSWTGLASADGLDTKQWRRTWWRWQDRVGAREDAVETIRRCARWTLESREVDKSPLQESRLETVVQSLLASTSTVLVDVERCLEALGPPPRDVVARALQRLFPAAYAGDEAERRALEALPRELPLEWIEKMRETGYGPDDPLPGRFARLRDGVGYAAREARALVHEAVDGLKRR